jgi:hypothetical protein
MRLLIVAAALSMATTTLAQAPRAAQPSARDALGHDADTLRVSVGLIRADNKGPSDRTLGGLDSTLRGVLRFSAYHGIAFGASLAYPGKTFDVTWFVDPNHQKMRAFCTVEHLNNDTNPATAQLRLRLAKVDSANTAPETGNVIVADVTIPEDHVVVVGSGAYGESALALTVRWRKGPFPKKP